MSASPTWFHTVHQTPAKPGHKVIFHAFCQDCGIEVKACWRCQKRKEYLDGACRVCHNSFACAQPDDPTDPSVAPMFICERCDQNRTLESMYGPFERELDKEIYNYKYEPVCSCCPLSTSNVSRIPQMENLARHPAGMNWHSVDAQKAFKKELEFSGNYAQALIHYASFFQHRPKGEAPPASHKILLKLLKKNI